MTEAPLSPRYEIVFTAWFPSRQIRKSWDPSRSSENPSDGFAQPSSRPPLPIRRSIDRHHALLLRRVEYDHALGRAAGDADAFDRHADELTAVGHQQHDFIGVMKIPISHTLTAYARQNHITGKVSSFPPLPRQRTPSEIFPEKAMHRRTDCLRVCRFEPPHFERLNWGGTAPHPA